MSFKIKDIVSVSGGTTKGVLVAESSHYDNSFIVEWEDGSSSIENVNNLESFSYLEETFRQVSKKIDKATSLLSEIKDLTDKTGRNLIDLHRSGDVDISMLESILEGNGLYTSRNDSGWDSSAKCW